MKRVARRCRKKARRFLQREIQTIRKWIESGAKWPAGFRIETQQIDTDWWSLRPIASPPAPRLSAIDESCVRNDVDRFVLQRLREHALKPSPPADRRTLIRRLYYDLIGLPPTAEEIEAFEEDLRSDAYERLVNRLLASPHYGERWARHWLDLVHYGDTHGFDKDKLRPNAWHYRDWVISSFNSDMPYTQFVQQQIAGDVLDPHDEQSIIATGMLVAGPFDWVGHIEVANGTVEKQRIRNLESRRYVVHDHELVCQHNGAMREMPRPQI